MISGNAWTSHSSRLTPSHSLDAARWLRKRSAERNSCCHREGGKHDAVSLNKRIHLNNCDLPRPHTHQSDRTHVSYPNISEVDHCVLQASLSGSKSLNVLGSVVTPDRKSDDIRHSSNSEAHHFQKGESKDHAAIQISHFQTMESLDHFSTALENSNSPYLRYDPELESAHKSDESLPNLSFARPSTAKVVHQCLKCKVLFSASHFCPLQATNLAPVLKVAPQQTPNTLLFRKKKRSHHRH
jgi:hypothetical protein